VDLRISQIAHWGSRNAWKLFQRGGPEKMPRWAAAREARALRAATGLGRAGEQEASAQFGVDPGKGEGAKRPAARS